LHFEGNLFERVRGEYRNRDVHRCRVFAQSLQKLDSAESRHFQIEQEKLELGVVTVLGSHAAEVIDCLLTVPDMDERMRQASFLESTTQEKNIVFVVISNENMFCVTPFARRHQSLLFVTATYADLV